MQRKKDGVWYAPYYVVHLKMVGGVVRGEGILPLLFP